MSVSEVYTGTTPDANLVMDATRNYLGARGINMVEAERTVAPSGDPLLNSVRKQYPLYDGHGNMVASLIRGSDSTFQLVNEKRYDAWGTVMPNTPPGEALANPSESYCANLGHKLDAESGLIYMRARYYEPSSGRFISEDPACDGWNWFAYCDNEPVGNTDPTGEFGLPDLMNGVADEVTAKFAEAQQARVTSSWAQNAIQSALRKWSEKVAPELLAVLYGQEFNLTLRQGAGLAGKGMMLTGVDGRYGIGIVTVGQEIVVKTYQWGQHIAPNVNLPIAPWW